MTSETKTVPIPHTSGWERIKAWTRRILLSENFVLYLSIAYFLVLIPFIPRIASGKNLANVFSNMWPLLILAIGQTFVLLLAGIDLSQTSIMAMASVIGGIIMTSQVNPVLFEKSPLWGVLLTEAGGPLGGSPWAAPVGILAMVLAGSLIGLLNGISVAKFKMPPFMVTLVSMIFFSGFAIYLTKSENVTHLPDAYIAIGKGQIGFVPYSFILAGILALVAHFLLTRTVLGYWFYGVGRNVRTSLVSGIPTDRVMILAYVFSGFCAALAAVLYSARLEGGRPTLGQNLLLDVIGATVIGGVSLFGGKGKIQWALYGVLFYTLLANSLNLLNLSYFTINIVKGGVILLAALLDVLRTRFLAQETSA
ncbi:MAG: hypothetical protein CSA11_02470 [Chloroflexi bacterium]|nr:MAG: hypothetical protein CSA11_02470 [Chloroflexota bacterium]